MLRVPAEPPPALQLEASRCRSLWCAVLQRAVEDAVSTAKFSAGKTNSELARARAHARAWLTGNSADFRRVCDLAGIDANAALERMLLLEQRGWPAPPKQPKDPQQRERRRRERNARRRAA